MDSEIGNNGYGVPSILDMWYVYKQYAKRVEDVDPRLATAYRENGAGISDLLTVIFMAPTAALEALASKRYTKSNPISRYIYNVEGLVKLYATKDQKGITWEDVKTPCISFFVRQLADVHNPDLKKCLTLFINWTRKNVFPKDARIELRLVDTFGPNQYGVFATGPIRAKTALALYNGIGLTHEPGDGLPMERKSSYVIAANDEVAENCPHKRVTVQYLDAERFFGLNDMGRWFNHTDAPNAKLLAQELDFAGELQVYNVMVETTMPVKADEELTVSYGKNYFQKKDKPPPPCISLYCSVCRRPAAYVGQGERLTVCGAECLQTLVKLLPNK